ncbi:hypothetical protein M9H77_30444 [Catharanthus roseus]|uniref:Uncharacterized protein n=1 Tax=Catharanthus roseus TaxID=4058 RepID=A0ACB9ZYK1_CATRO|nr:hypothetical protein M9H77_30444 [Catharanthus roseus]
MNIQMIPNQDTKANFSLSKGNTCLSLELYSLMGFNFSAEVSGSDVRILDYIRVMEGDYESIPNFDFHAHVGEHISSNGGVRAVLQNSDGINDMKEAEYQTPLLRTRLAALCVGKNFSRVVPRKTREFSKCTARFGV